MGVISQVHTETNLIKIEIKVCVWGVEWVVLREAILCPVHVE